MIKEILKSKTLVMDGALGTELEDMVPKDSKFQPRYHSLWSGTVLLNQPDLVYEVHRKYLEEGCDIILTSSYQLSFQGLEDQLGASLEKAQEIWDKSVAVADKAIRDYSISHHRNSLAQLAPTEHTYTTVLSTPDSTEISVKKNWSNIIKT